MYFGNYIVCFTEAVCYFPLTANDTRGNFFGHENEYKRIEEFEDQLGTF